MSAERDDAEIREQYRRLRQQDERLGRPLGTLLPAAGRRPRRQPYRRQAASRPRLRPANSAATGDNRSRGRLSPVAALLVGRGQLRQLGTRLAAAALALALAAGAGALLRLRPRPAPPPQEAVIARLSHWRAPTDSLLHTPGDQWLRVVPRLGESSIDAHSNGNLKGNSNGGNRTR